MGLENKQRILSQLFDIKPTTFRGELDTVKILGVRGILDLKGAHEGKSIRDSEITKFLERDKPISITPKEEEGEAEEEFWGRAMLPERSLKEAPHSEEGLPTRDELLRELAEIDKEIDKEERSKQ